MIRSAVKARIPAMKPRIDKRLTNLKALESAFASLKRDVDDLMRNPNGFGSIDLKVQINDGVIAYHQSSILRSEQSEKVYEAVSA